MMPHEQQPALFPPTQQKLCTDRQPDRAKPGTRQGKNAHNSAENANRRQTTTKGGQAEERQGERRRLQIKRPRKVQTHRKRKHPRRK